MTSSAEKRLHQTGQNIVTALVNFARNTEKAIRHLRIAFNTYNTQLLNQYDLQSIGDSNNA